MSEDLKSLEKFVQNELEKYTASLDFAANANAVSALLSVSRKIRDLEKDNLIDHLHKAMGTTPAPPIPPKDYESLYIGSDPANGLVVPSLASFHTEVRFYRTGGYVNIVDLGTAAGTHLYKRSLNDTFRIQRLTPMDNEDILTYKGKDGDIKFTYEGLISTLLWVLGRDVLFPPTKG